MKEYKVRIRETLEMIVTVEADNAAQAREIVERNWKDSEYVLDAAHFTGVTFTVPSRNDRER
ncbi:MAG TPA: hypothetical protein DEQ02_03805 [Ruminococcaceae bacterium]|nr:hypothetical protein [Oscillospiraceae bacterium]